ncbi:GGDEF domain-containing protein [Tissierella pigra]|uniref:GGDEF domain-containing protein n=1 Tax=Tissierella pigra TaxID=2607614 RepID=A0A6N7XML9_9FIRM|nr:GGDEF domain-containing protein [Tissierella pigra]MBU5428020.1 GGDEF domain-containing protein [Tissierella pigra]MSU03341.1 GGDEF domain-containing protein [Tissierella pigra]
MANHTSKGKYYDIKIYFKAIMILWICTLVCLMFYSNNKINYYVKEQVGNRVTILATYIANSLELTDEDILYLKSLSFEELLKNEINQKFQDSAKSIKDNLDYKHIYLTARLDKGEIKDNNNIIYILDTAETKINDFRDGDYYKGSPRYGMSDDLFEEVEKTKIPSYRVFKTKLSEHICAYAPFYTTEGNYVGLIGLKVSLNLLESISSNYMNIIVLFIVINLIIGSIAFFMYRHMNSVCGQLESQKHISEIDDLTCVFNRRKFNEILQSLWRNAKENREELSLALIDLDYFKEFNDNYGHIAGDTLLRDIGSVLKRRTKPFNGYVCRYGGDEFVILFPQLDLYQSEKVANEILEEVNSLKLIHEYSPIDNHQTVSIGIASTIPTNEMDPYDLLKDADNALYLSKRYGRNRVSISK